MCMDSSIWILNSLHNVEFTAFSYDLGISELFYFA